MTTEASSFPAQDVSLGTDPVPGGSRLAAGAGVAFAVLLFVSVSAFSAPRAATDAELTAWWSDAANLHSVVLSTFSYLGAGLCFLVFAGYLQARLRAVAPASFGTAVIGMAATAFVTIMALTGSMGALARGILIDNEPLPGPDLLRYLPQIRYTALGAFALPVAGLLIAATSYLILRHGGLPAWTGWLGVLSVIVILGTTALYIGQYAIPVLMLWVLCVSITVLLRPAPAPRAA
jgi:hypothetical protein